MSIMVGDSETIRRFIFPQCEEDKHHLCPSWQPGYVDGQLRSAGEQCSCPCGHKKDLSKLTLADLPREHLK